MSRALLSLTTPANEIVAGGFTCLALASARGKMLAVACIPSTQAALKNLILSHFKPRYQGTPRDKDGVVGRRRAPRGAAFDTKTAPCPRSALKQSVDDHEQEHPQLNCFASLRQKTNSWPASQKHPVRTRVHTDNKHPHNIGTCICQTKYTGVD